MSDFWIRKMRTYFRIWDYDKDGVIPLRDVENIVMRFCDLENADSVQKETVRQLVFDLFSHYTSAPGTDGDVLMTEDVLIESMKTRRNDPAFTKTLSDALLSVFAVMKLKHDGYFQQEEFHKYFTNAGVIDPKFTKKAFEAIDVDRDGKLSFKEFINSCIVYLCSDDENTGALFGVEA